ncbi:MAG: hypothetical protein J7L55_03625 [Desulfurococcales archaeon]|nr:hypothetical protein [Desulfurococcales archaeon]
MVFRWPPLRRGFKITVVLPSSSLSIYPTLREKTEFIGRVSRSLAVFRVEKVVVVSDSRDSDLFVTILRYLQLAPYLRRKLVPLSKELQYVGVLPPLNIATHNPEGAPPREGMLRDGLVEVSWGLKGRVFIGERRRCIAESRQTLSPGERVLVRIVKEDPLRCKVEDPAGVREYVGYQTISVDIGKSFGVDVRGSLSVVTSKNGKSFSKGLARKLWGDILRGKAITLYFGNHEKDFDEILQDEGFEVAGAFDYKINFIPDQGTLTVRSDEALISVLAALDTSSRLVSRGSKT